MEPSIPQFIHFFKDCTLSQLCRGRILSKDHQRFLNSVITWRLRMESRGEEIKLCCIAAKIWPPHEHSTKFKFQTHAEILKLILTLAQEALFKPVSKIKWHLPTIHILKDFENHFLNPLKVYRVFEDEVLSSARLNVDSLKPLKKYVQDKLLKPAQDWSKTLNLRNANWLFIHNITLKKIFFRSVEVDPQSTFWWGLYCCEQSAYKEGVNHVLWAAKKGLPAAQFEYGIICNKHKNEIDKKLWDHEKKWIQAAAEKGDPRAQEIYGYSFKSGYWNNAIDTVKAEYWYRKAVAQGNGQAYFNITFLPQISPEEAHQFRILALNEGIQVEYHLGIDFLKGRGIKKDIPLAIHYLQKAADLGEGWAFYELGRLNCKGKEIPVNIPYAVSLLKKAVEKEVLQACLLLGKIHLKTNPPNQDRAYYWFSKGKNIPQCLYQLGVIHYEEKRPYMGWDCIKRALDQGHPGTYVNLAKNNLYFKKGQEAVNLLKKVEGSPKIYNFLGKIYCSGAPGVLKNISEALKLFKLSAEKGYPEGEYNLALMFLNGQGVEKNLNKALEYFKKALAHGYLKAQQEIEKIEALQQKENQEVFDFVEIT